MFYFKINYETSFRDILSFSLFLYENWKDESKEINILLKLLSNWL